MIKIIVDSTFDLPEEIINQLNIDIIPLRVLIGEKEFYDKTDITVKEVYDAMRSGIMPKTSQPNLVHVRELFKGYAERNENFVYISFSAKMSGTYQSAKLILEELKEEYPNVKMEVIDSKGGSQGIGLMVLGIHERIQKGASFEEVIKVLNFYRDNVEHFFNLTDLNWLSKGGRLSKGKAVVGSLMNIKPILKIEDGEIIHFKSVRGKKKATKEMINEVLDLIPKRDFKYIGIGHSDDLEMAITIKETLEKQYPDKNYLLTDIGSVLTSHLGIGGTGILLMSEYIDEYNK
ncbi:DegV family protein [Oceanirhabdus sp. W0125-5]|uniref:DegV family protein n=1 Tax=Oceanirhabdus sp. W0125-5 TaxID=2999116 RepID=UPI0022F3155C|nr:DegV family protein [Oceanirhabdus sp. W0125-5]WBW99522.1 DegV family protein [Oceanirhabdus sp. W0125-5]